MSAQEFKPGDRARCIETWTTHVIDSGDEFTVEDVDPTTRNGLEVFVQGEWVPARYFEKVKPQFFVGQRVSGDDYKRLPVGAVVADPTGVATKVAENVWRWDDGAEDADEEVRMERTLTHLPDAAEPEDKDDLYVEPEPLKEGDWVQVWAKVHDPSPRDDELVELRVRIRGGGMATAYTTNDAIVRPDAGQVPPWVNVATANVAAIARVLMDEGGMEHAAAFAHAESLDRAGIRAEGGA